MTIAISRLASLCFGIGIAFSASSGTHERRVILGEIGAWGLNTMFLGLIATVAFIGWQYQAHKNLRALGNENLQWAPGWSICCWLIGPIGLALLAIVHWSFGSSVAVPAYHWSPPWVVAGLLIDLPSLILPFLVLRQIWRSSDPQTHSADVGHPSGPRLPIAWWGCYLAAVLLAVIALLTASLTAFILVPLAIAVVAEAILSCIIIVQVNAMQEKRIELLRTMRTEVASPHRASRSDQVGSPVSNGKKAEDSRCLQAAKFATFAFCAPLVIVLIDMWLLSLFSAERAAGVWSLLWMVAGLTSFVVVIAGAVLGLVGLVGGFQYRSLGIIAMAASGSLLNGALLFAFIWLIFETIRRLH